MKNYSPYYGDIIIDENHQPIIVFIVGKVGSKTVIESLYNAENIPYCVYHVHSLAPQVTEEIKEQSKSIYDSTNSIVSFNIKLSEYITKNYNNYRWKVITMIRDPFAISLSMFFELIDTGTVEYYYPELFRNGNMDATFQQFSEIFHTACFKHIMYVEKWLNTELKSFFGIDVFEYPFDHEKGFSIISKGNVDLLTIRTENLNKCFKNAIKDFIGIDNITMINENVGEHKHYSNLYKFIKDKFVLKEAYANDIYNSNTMSKVVNHFYSDNEVKNFISKWTEKKNLTDEDYIKYDLDRDNIFKNINELLKRMKEYHLDLNQKNN